MKNKTISKALKDEALFELQQRAKLITKLESWLIEIDGIEENKQIRHTAEGISLTSEGKYHYQATHHLINMVLNKIKELKQIPTGQTIKKSVYL